MNDILIVGSGLYGAVVAQQLYQHGMKVKVIERRNHVGGNIYDKTIDGITIHNYGAHIFHTDDYEVWKYVNQFAEFVNYIHNVIARHDNKIYHLPFNLNTFNDVFGATKPEDVDTILEIERKREFYPNPLNFEEHAINLIGRTMYDILVKGYTEKQWGRKATHLSKELITRLPIRKTFDNRYFNDKYQGVPKGGYTKMIKKMLHGIDIETNVDFCKNKEYWIDQACQVLYTGSLDECMDYCLGELEYRSLDFVTERLDISNFQGTAVINETGRSIPYTRTIEHKHFNYEDNTSFTIITREYPKKWERGMEAYYPINNMSNESLHQKYVELLKNKYPNMLFGGRLAEYKYYDMDDTIKNALNLATKIIDRE